MTAIPKVMLIDDDPDIIKLGKLSLSGIAKWTVITSTSAREALVQAIQDKPDLIIMDTSMPDMDGLSLMERFHVTEGLEDIPILLTTTRIEEGEEEFYKSKGACGLIEKPFNPETLPHQIVSIVGS